MRSWVEMWHRPSRYANHNASLPLALHLIISLFLSTSISHSHPHPSSLLPTTLYQIKLSFLMLLCTYFSTLSDSDSDLHPVLSNSSCLSMATTPHSIRSILCKFIVSIEIDDFLTHMCKRGMGVESKCNDFFSSQYSVLYHIKERNFYHWCDVLHDKRLIT